MESILTIPVRCSIIFAIVALVGTSCSHLTRFFNAPAGEILAGQSLVRTPVAPPRKALAAPSSLQADQADKRPPFNFFIPLIVAGTLLFAWQATDFAKLWKRAKADNLPTHLRSQKSPQQPNLHR